MSNRTHISKLSLALNRSRTVFCPGRGILEVATCPTLPTASQLHYTTLSKNLGFQPLPCQTTTTCSCPTNLKKTCSIYNNEFAYLHWIPHHVCRMRNFQEPRAYSASFTGKNSRIVTCFLRFSNAHARAMYFADPPSIFLPFQPQNCHVGQILQDPVRELLELVVSDVDFCQLGQTLEGLVWELRESVVIQVQSGQVGQALEDLA